MIQSLYPFFAMLSHLPYTKTQSLMFLRRSNHKMDPSLCQNIMNLILFNCKKRSSYQQNQWVDGKWYRITCTFHHRLSWSTLDRKRVEETWDEIRPTILDTAKWGGNLIPVGSSSCLKTYSAQESPWWHGSFRHRTYTGAHSITILLAKDGRRYWEKTCEWCVRRKRYPDRDAPLVNIQTSRPIELVCMDFLSLEPDNRNTRDILVVTDHFTKYAIAIPTRDQKATTVAKAL